MLFAPNAETARFQTGTTTAANFAGLPLVGTCRDYTTSDPSEEVDNQTATQKLFDFAITLKVPAVVTDVVHDGAGMTGALSSMLASLSTLVAPGFGGPILHPSAGSPLPCGPILDFEPAFDPGDHSKAYAVALATINWRRNHKYRHGCDALWPNPTDTAPLDKLQRPPIYKASFTFYRADPAGGPPTQTRFMVINGGPEYFDALLSAWKGPQAGYFASVPSGGAASSSRAIIVAGLTALAAQEGTYPGIGRHFAPWLVPFVQFGLVP